MKASDPSGLIRIESESIVYTIPGQEGWRVPIGAVKVIGAFTNDHGPILDDYFLVFATSNKSSWFEAPVYADGLETFLAELGRRLHADLQPGLANSADFKSQVIWPQHLRGQALFDFVPEPPAGAILGRLRQRILPRAYFRFTGAVQKELLGRPAA